jgi:EPS-associated MarR family transcriptional regulator
MNEEISCKVIKIIEENPDTSQRQLAETLGISLGKTYYCLKALIEKGIIKASNFKSSHNKHSHIYL